jgi:beta-lactamase class A
MSINEIKTGLGRGIPRLVLIGLIGVGVGVALVYGTQRIQASSKEQTYPLLAKRVQIDNPNEVVINFTGLRSNLAEYISSLGENSDKVSVYFEYLPTGVSLNINEKNESIAASLMKLPVVMNLYKASETGRLDLDKKVSIKKESLDSGYGTLYQKGEGYEISLRDAARLALKDSDNTALLTIWNELGKDQLPLNDDALNYLDIEYGVVEDGRAQIGTRSYSSILKCLYFACFNTKSDSEEILEYLTESTFDYRLTKYLPEDIKVAHKIGTYTTRYQSDCGITYLQGKNYAICIMVEGNDPEASEIIADLSNRTYLYLTEK